jgi:glyceraldehyde 3-phosphate dehydrogenase
LKRSFKILNKYNMSKKRIAINGFGRIGRLTFRFLQENPDLEVVAINDLTSNKILAHLLKYDTAHGPFKGTVEYTENSIIVNGREILATAIRNPEELPWKENNIDVVLECTGIFRSKEKAGMHITAGAKKVAISAPASGKDVKTVVLGVNGHELTADLDIVSNASCTTNCLAPLVKVIKDNWGFEFGSVTTTHAYTADQNLQDAPHSDLRRARAAAQNIVPTSTGAANAVGLVIDGVEGKFSAIALRVPTITGSLVELNCKVEKNVTAEEINAKFKENAEGAMKGILQYSEDPLVSSDIIGNKYSSIFDSQLTGVLNGNFVKVCSWYDNEAGYSARLADLAAKL